MLISKLDSTCFPVTFEEWLAIILLKGSLEQQTQICNPYFIATCSVVILWYFKLSLVDLTKFGAEFELSKFYDIRLQRYRDYNISVCDKDSTP